MAGISHNPIFVYRGDDRSPSIIFATGFSAQGANYDLANHVRGGPDSGYVSTTLSEVRAADFACGAALSPASAWVYTVDLRGKPTEVYIDAALFNINEDEVAFVDHIPVEQIVCAQLWDWVSSPDGTGRYQPIGPKIMNPNRP